MLDNDVSAEVLEALDPLKPGNRMQQLNSHGTQNLPERKLFHAQFFSRSGELCCNPCLPKVWPPSSQQYWQPQDMPSITDVIATQKCWLGSQTYPGNNSSPTISRVTFDSTCHFFMFFERSLTLICNSSLTGLRCKKNRYLPDLECSTAFSMKSTIVLLLNFVKLPKLKLPERDNMHC